MSAEVYISVDYVTGICLLSDQSVRDEQPYPLITHVDDQIHNTKTLLKGTRTAGKEERLSKDSQGLAFCTYYNAALKQTMGCASEHQDQAAQKRFGPSLQKIVTPRRPSNL
jgi:hypothetical protein